MIKIFCINCKLLLNFLFSAKDNVTNKNYGYYRCKKCQIIQISPFPLKENLYNIRDSRSQFMSTNPQARLVNSLPFGNFLINKYLELTKNRINEVFKLKKIGRILDVGCASGGFLKNFSNNWELHGLEINSHMAKAARKDLPNAKIYFNRIESEKLPKNYFDVITLWHVFEHLENPRLVLKKIHSSLKPEGHVIIEVPNAQSLYRKIFTQYWQLLLVPEHLYFYSKKSLSQILINNGFTITKVKFFAIFTPSALSSLANFLRSCGLNSNLAIITGLALLPVILIVNLFSFSARENLMVIAKKR